MTNENQCGLEPANIPSDCFNRPGKEEEIEICCLATSPEDKKFCHLFPNSTELYESLGRKYEGTQVIDDVTYKINCEDNETLDTIGYDCGTYPITSVDDCTSATDKMNPCCLFNNTVTGSLACFRLGTITQSSLITYDNNIINCFSPYFSLSFFSVFISIILLFI